MGDGRFDHGTGSTLRNTMKPVGCGRRDGRSSGWRWIKNSACELPWRPLRLRSGQAMRGLNLFSARTQDLRPGLISAAPAGAGVWWFCAASSRIEPLSANLRKTEPHTLPEATAARARTVACAYNARRYALCVGEATYSAPLGFLGMSGEAAGGTPALHGENSLRRLGEKWRCGSFDSAQDGHELALTNDPRPASTEFGPPLRLFCGCLGHPSHSVPVSTA